MAKPQPKDLARRQWLEDAVRLVAEGTSDAVGENFFRTLVRQLATVLQVRFAFISEFHGTGKLRITALWEGTDFGENFEYEAYGTPCELVFKEGLCYYPSRLQETFPEDRWLQQKGIQSYLAIPLYDAGGNPFGHMGAMHDAPMIDDLPRESILRIFAARAAAELERKHGEDHLQEQATQLSRANQYLSALHAVTASANQSLDLDTVLSEVIKTVTGIFHFDETRIYILDSDRNQLQLRSHTDSELAFRTNTHTWEQGLGGKPLQIGAPLIFENIQIDPHYQAWARNKNALREGFRFLAVFPIKSKQKLLGTLACYGRTPRRLKPDEIQLINSMSNQIGVAVEKAQLYEQTKRQASQLEKDNVEFKRVQQRLQEQTNQLNNANQQLSALYAVTAAVSGSLDLNQILEKALDAILDVTGLKVGYIRLLEGSPPRLNLKVHRGISPGFVELLRHGPRPGGRSDRIVTTKQSLIFENIPVHHTGHLRNHAIAEGFNVSIGVPIIFKDRVVGIINVGAPSTSNLNPGHVCLLESIGASLGIVLENATLYRESQRNEEIQRLLKELSQDITFLDIDSLLKKLTEKIRQTFKVDVSDVRVLENGVWRVMGVSGIDPEHLQSDRPGSGETRSGWIIEHRKPLSIPDITRAGEFPSGETLNALGLRGYVGVPLISREGEAIGVMRALNYQPREFTEDEMGLLHQLANGAAMAIENAQLFDQVKAGREQMQILTRRLVEAQEVERHTIARELHDEIGQVLTGLKLTLEASRRLPADRYQERLIEAQGLINELMVRVRGLSLDLRPPMLDDLGLLPTLLWLFERFAFQTNLKLNFKHTKIKGRRFSPEVETAIFRILQEAVTNVARHASANEATVRLRAINGTLNLQVEDQGAGFDVKAVMNSGMGAGLAGMRERAVALSGQLTIESQPGAGTRLAVTLPLGQTEAKRE